MMVSKYNQIRWRLDDLYPGPDSSALQRSLDLVEERTRGFEALRPQLRPDLTAAEFINILKAYENLVRLLTRLLNYGFLLISEDVQSPPAQNYWAQAQQIVAHAESRTIFFNLWWTELGDEAAEKLLSAVPTYGSWLEALRTQKPFILSEAEEKIISFKDAVGSKGLLKLYETITGRYEFKLEIDGEVMEFRRHDLNDQVRSPDPEVRAAAYREFLRVYQRDKPILGQIYQHRVQGWHSENVLLRGYASPIAARNLINGVPDNVIEVLLGVCRDNASLFQKYFRLKAHVMGMERLRRYDIYAPVTRFRKTYSFNDAVEMVLESFRQFYPEFANLAQRVFDENHLDSEVRDRKRPGAFCVAVDPLLTPWVSICFDGDLESIAGLARELGRAIHYLLSAHHNALTQKAPRLLSDVVSTFCEMLAFDFLMANDPESEMKQQLFFRRMDNAYAAIMRQAYFVMFERKAHDRIFAGATIDELCGIYFDGLKEQFSGSLDLSDDFRDEWLCISTFFHLPFYVYANAFSRLLALSLYREHQNGGDAFKLRYVNILEAGGSDSPVTILKQAGIDVTTANFWQSGFDVIAGAMEDFETTENNKKVG